MHIHFITHVTTPKEIEQLPCLTAALQQYFPDSELHVFNQTLSPIAGSIVCENIKECGFVWTLRFLGHALPLMSPDSVLIKVDPDTEINGNPLEGVEIPQGAFFGQTREMGCCSTVFFGGFQGYTYEAVKAMLKFGTEFANKEGPQDIIAHRVIDVTLQPFVTLPEVQLWADGPRPEGGPKVWHLKHGRTWKRYGGKE